MCLWYLSSLVDLLLELICYIESLNGIWVLSAQYVHFGCAYMCVQVCKCMCVWSIFNSWFSCLYLLNAAIIQIYITTSSLYCSWNGTERFEQARHQPFYQLRYVLISKIYFLMLLTIFLPNFYFILFLRIDQVNAWTWQDANTHICII